MTITEQIELTPTLAGRLDDEAAALGVSRRWLIAQKLASGARVVALDEKKAASLADDDRWAVDLEITRPGELGPAQLDDWLSGLAGKLVLAIDGRGRAVPVRLVEPVEASMHAGVITARFTAHPAQGAPGEQLDWPLHSRYVRPHNWKSAHSMRQIRRQRVAQGRCRDCGFELDATAYRCPSCNALRAEWHRQRRQAPADQQPAI